MWALRDEMRDAFQECIDDIDRYEEREDGEEGAMIRVIVRLIISHGHVTFTRKEKQGTEIKNGWGDQDENKKEKGPILFKAPAVKNPPGNHQKKENVQDPQGMDPIDAAMRARLQHFTQTLEHASHAQGEHNGNQNREITERIH